MQTISWNHQCYYCRRPITRGKPTLLFSTDEALFAGISHSTCCAGRLQFGRYQMCPPDRLLADQVAFLMYFYPMVYKLPGSENPDIGLRLSLTALLNTFPMSLNTPMSVLNSCVQRHHNVSNLELDFIKFLGKVHRLVNKNPGDVEVDFRK